MVAAGKGEPRVNPPLSGSVKEIRGLHTQSHIVCKADISLKMIDHDAPQTVQAAHNVACLTFCRSGR